MKKKDSGLMHYIYALILISWAVTALLCFVMLLRTQHLKKYLEDAMTQAGLAALLIEPYTYGKSGELIFGDPSEVEALYTEYLQEGLGSEENRDAAGIGGDITLASFIIYELTASEIREYERQEDGTWVERTHSLGETVYAPDQTRIVSSTIYSRIRLPVRVWGSVTVEVERQHCVDIVRN
ncbi:MAG: hypothetical protein LUE87_08285 [Lachnospiraceae bacterium]|nr:hypothetical protein [Lachnospiraceae bacterium]